MLGALFGHLGEAFALKQTTLDLLCGEVALLADVVDHLGVGDLGLGGLLGGGEGLLGKGLHWGLWLVGRWVAREGLVIS